MAELRPAFVCSCADPDGLLSVRPAVGLDSAAALARSYFLFYVLANLGLIDITLMWPLDLPVCHFARTCLLPHTVQRLGLHSMTWPLVFVRV